MGGGVSKTTPMPLQAKQLFTEIDVNKDGKLSVEELANAARKYGENVEKAWPEHRIRDVLIQHDVNKDDMLDLQEWTAALKALDVGKQMDGETSPGSFKRLPTSPKTRTDAVFTDAAFPPDSTSLGVGEDRHFPDGIVWVRACEVFDGAPLLPSKLSHASVMQGFKNDCFYVAAMALLASKGSLVNSNGDPLIRPGKTEGEFVATLVEKAGGETVEVTIDDMIPVSAVSGQPLYAHARDGDALCFSLLEKALAKRFGSFAALDGGNTSEALWELTGCAVEDVKLDGLSGEACAKLVRGFLDAGELIGCGHIDTAHRGEYCANASGIRSNHAYAVVGATAKEVQVYNPMGIDDSFTGKADGAGTLRMPWSAFAKSFSRLQVCRLSSRTSAPHLSTWTSLEWREGSAGGCTSNASFRRNPMLRLGRFASSTKRVSLSVVVGTPDRRGKSNGPLSYPQLGLTAIRLHKGAVYPMVTPENYDVVGKTSAFWNKREVATCLQLDVGGGEGDGEVLLVPSTFHPGETSPFWVSVRSSVPLPGPEWRELSGSFETASWQGGTKKNRLRLKLETEGAHATAGSAFVFLRQRQSDRQPVGLHVLSADGGTVVQKASFVKALEISVELKLADGPLLLCPCCFKDALEADLDVEVLAPTGVKLAISATEAAASNLETVAGLLEPAAPRNGKAAAAGGKKGGKSKGAAKGAMSMAAAKKTTDGLGGLYAGLE